MGGFQIPGAMPQDDPNQQLNQPPQYQSVQQPSPDLPLEKQQQPQQGDALTQIKNQLAQQYQTLSAQTPANRGGRIKQLLTNFVSGAGNAMLHDAGLPTPYEQQQRLLTNIQGIENTQAITQLHSAMAGMYGTEPIQVPDSSDPSGYSTIGVMRKDVPKIQQALISSQARLGAAGITGQSRIQAAQINQGIMMPLTPEQAKDLGFPPGTTQIPLKQLGQATRTALAPLGMAQGAQGPAQYNKFDPTDTQSLGVGNPRIAAQDARWTPVAEMDEDGNPTGAVHLMRAGAAGAAGAETPQSIPFQAAKGVARSATSGSIFNTTQAYDLAIAHMQTFRQIANALDNGQMLLANKIGQTVGTQLGGDKATNFNIVKAAFAGEVGKAFAGANVALGDRQELAGKINSASSPAQLKGYADTAQALLEGKRSVLRQGVKQGLTGRPDVGNGNAGVTSFSQWKSQQGR